MGQSCNLNTLSAPTFNSYDTLADQLGGSVISTSPTTRVMAFEGLTTTTFLQDYSRAQVHMAGMLATATLVGEDALSEPDISEARLIGQFVEQVREIDESLPDLMVPVQGEKIRDITEFALSPMVAYDYDEPVRGARSTDIFGEGVPIDPLLTGIYLNNIGIQPELDSRYGIGLDFRQGIIAVASAGVDLYGQLLINQIQAAPGIVRPERGGDAKEWQEYLDSGLHHGFFWRHTLVRAWTRVAKEIGCSAVVVQSHINNRSPLIQERGAGGYDSVAGDLGFTQQADLNWILPL